MTTAIATIVEKPRVMATDDYARSLFQRGTDCLGAREVKQVFGIDIAEPPIPFTEDELTRGRALGQFLNMVVDKKVTGAPLTMKGVDEVCKGKLGNDPLLYNRDWYRNELFYTTDPVVKKATWKLVTRDVIPGSLGENYLVQTQALVDYLVNEVFAGVPLPELYQVAVDEFEANKSRLVALMDNNWQKAAEELSALKVNQLFRLSPGELVYSIALYQGVNHERLLQGMYSWTAARLALGHLVFVGRADALGALAFGGDPRHSRVNLGVLFSRSGLAES